MWVAQKAEIELLAWNQRSKNKTYTLYKVQIYPQAIVHTVLLPSPFTILALPTKHTFCM